MNPASYPLRIGVTGHRNLPDEPAVAQAVEHVLEHVEETLLHAAARSGQDRRPISRAIDRTALALVRPLLQLLGLPKVKSSAAVAHKTAIDWIVVSPLAKGADRIVARAVLAKDGAALQAVSPFPVDEYRKDFRDATDREAFEELWRQGESPVELHTGLKATEIDWTNQQHRNQAYYHVGRYVVDACELFIAIWDGKPAAGFGGTGDIVRYAISRGRRVIWIDANEPHRPPCLLVPDVSSNEPFAGASVKRLPRLAKQLSLGYHRLAAYNRDPFVAPADVEQATQQDVAWLRQQASDRGLPNESLGHIERQLLPLYARADSLAIAYQRLYLFGAKALFRLSAFAVSIAVLQILFFPTANWIIGMEVLAMLTAVLLLRVSRVEAWHEKWLNDRHMAEWLRSAVFTSLLGDQQGRRAKTTELPFYEGPDQWFVDTFGKLVAHTRSKTPAIEFNTLKQYLIEQWIAGQAEWHARNAVKKKHSAHLYHRLGIICFCATLVMATLHMFGVGHATQDGSHRIVAQADHHLGSSHASPDDALQAHQDNDQIGGNRFADMSSWISFFAVILPAWGASIHAIASLLEYDRIAARSERMARVLERCAERARRATNSQALVKEIDAAEEIMAAENHEWVASLKFRELVLPS
ncbi:MAG: hypothetical protein HYV60_04225 [Planctomycetia bacterium]|nr:hypothetical protein [Planctomycetia bacterium]